MFLATVGVVLASPTATRAQPVPAPDSAHIALMRIALLNFDDVRVVTDGTKLSGHRGLVSSDGLQFRVSTDNSISASPQVHMVPWTEIESIRVRKGSSGAGPLIGGAVGLVLGSLAVAVESMGHALPFSQKRVSGTPILVGALGGAALGWAIDRPGPWETVYP